MTQLNEIAKIVLQCLKENKLLSKEAIQSGRKVFEVKKDKENWIFLPERADELYGRKVIITSTESEDNGRYDLIIYKESGHELFKIELQNDYGTMEIHMIKEYPFNFEILEKELKKIEKEN